MKKTLLSIAVCILLPLLPAYATTAIGVHGITCSVDTMTAAVTLNTTGASSIYVTVSSGFEAMTPTFSDTLSNTWVELTQRRQNSDIVRTFYVASPITGSSDTFNYVSAFPAFPVLQVTVVTGTATSPFDVENGNNTTGTSIATNSITPGQNNEIVFSGMVHDNSATVSINGGFTIIDQFPSNGSTCVGGATAYLVQTTATAANPTWSWTGSTDAAAEIASFKASAASGSYKTLTGAGK